MKKTVVIAAAVLLALLAAAGIVIATKQKDDSPPVRIIEEPMDNNTNTDIITNTNDGLLQAQTSQIADLRAQIEELERKMAQQEFDYTALKAEKDRLEKRNADLADQNSWLRGRNNELSSSEGKLRNDVAALGTEIAALNAELARISKEREENEAAYQEALAKIEEYEAQAAVTQAALDQANTPGTRTTEEGDTISTFKTVPQGQSRNIIGIKVGDSDVDIEATFALMPHWFLVADFGVAETPVDFVEEEFPGLKADHSFMYTMLFGTGLNWRINTLQPQPNFYISTMIGPAWYKYKDKVNDENGINTYLLWRSSVGFDMTLYKNLQFTTDISLDWMKGLELTPRVTVGLQWSFSNSWSLLGRK
ncbi:MAG: hypothetical protein J6W62_08545 [Spirochaetia bacterium]|nr:hypothetical protein [Spirochaetia bacterium]